MFKPVFLFTLIFFLPIAGAVVVLKTKEKKALVLLEGVKTQKGAYFDVFDLNGNKKGLARMDRIAETKAIVSLKSGSIAKKWFLEPVSKELALYELKKERKRRALSARIHRDQIKRKVAFKKQRLKKAKKRRLALKKQLAREKQRKLARMRALDKKRRLAKKKRAIKRKLASYSLEENVLEDLGEETMEQSPEVLSYEIPSQSDEAQANLEESKAPVIETEPELIEIEKDKSDFFTVGILPRVEYDFMKVSPLSASDYFMSGLGFGAVLSTGFALNPFIDLGANIGAKRFSVSAGEEECGRAGGCSLLIYYALASVNLKLNLIQFYGHKLWLMGAGTLLQPLVYSNKVPNLTKESFSPFHGAVGGGLGLEFNFGNFTIPVSLDAHIHMPPTQTTLTGNVGLQFGLSYKF
ncbi:MAG: hypothetical protein OXJ52_05280 [Oligoflexia bacterium]|nr:hypothetical protein [Oligoflexia bacterium]